MTAITRSIDIRTEIPGPRSREIVARREAQTIFYSLGRAEAMGVLVALRQAFCP